MSTATKPANLGKDVFKTLTNALGLGGNNSRTNTTGAAALPVTAGPVNGSATNQTGGMAPVNYRSAHMQPSEAVMKWATTAGAEMPSKAEMRGVAHGGRRRSRNRKTHGRRKSKRTTGGRSKTHRRRHHKRSKTHHRRRN